MKLKKATFNIRLNSETLKSVTGYIFEHGKFSYGLHREGSYWYMSELASGARIINGGETRQQTCDKGLQLVAEKGEKIMIDAQWFYINRYGLAND